MTAQFIHAYVWLALNVHVSLIVHLYACHFFTKYLYMCEKKTFEFSEPGHQCIDHSINFYFVSLYSCVQSKLRVLIIAWKCV